MSSSPAAATVRSVRSTTGGAGAPAAAVTISSGDLARMRRLADDAFRTGGGGPNENEARLRAQRKEASQARADRWPNTLVAMRKRKDQARVDAAAAREAEMVAEDEASQAVREQERLRMIAAAEELVRQQSDKYKILANYRQMSFDMDVMKRQAELKAHLEGEKRRQEEAWTQRILDELKRAAEEEAQKLEQARAKARAFAKERKEQLDAIIQRRIAEIRETEEAGRSMLAQTQAMEREAQAAAVARREESTRKLKEFAAENDRLKAIRAELKRSEAEMVAWIQAQAAAKDAQDARIKAVIERQREEAAKKAAVISSIMERDFLARKSTEDTRLANELAEAAAKSEAADQAKRKAQAEMRASIDAQIKEMKERTFAAIRAQMEEDAREHEAFKKDLAKWEAEEAARAREARSRKTQESKGWIREAASKSEAAAARRAAELAEAQAENAKLLGGPADKEFADAVEELAREERAKGHSTRPLYRMVHKVTNPALMSGGGR